MPILISSLLQSKSNQLERIHFFDNDIDDEQGADLINALILNCEMHRLFYLCLAGNHIGKTCGVAIGELLTHPACKLQTLDLGGNENFDDECMAMLLQTLDKNSTIKHLFLNSVSNVTPSGWEDLPNVFKNPMCAVEALNIGGNNFDDSTTWPLGNVLASNKALKDLDVSDCFEVDPDGWRGLTECLKSPGCALKKLNMSRISIEGISALAVFSNLSNNNTLKKFSMASNTAIEPEKWTSCFHELRRSRCVLEELDLSANNIDDAGVIALTQLLDNNLKTIISLNLQTNSSITSHGWCSFFQFLDKLPNSNLKEVYIGSDVGDPNINENVICFLAKALGGNSKLTALDLGRTNISTKGWNILTMALCDLWSIEDICNKSNHTLQRLICSQDLPVFIALLLHFNTLGKVTAARIKMILFMLLFQKDSVNRIFGLMPVSALPSAIAWMGTDRFGFSALYSLVRSVPALLESI